jgi:hypothetical protein
VAHADGLLGPSLEAAYAAAELAVVRKRWFVGWTELGNAPEAHSRALIALAKQRRAARYAETAINLNAGQLAEVLSVVDEMVEHAASAISQRPR